MNKRLSIFLLIFTGINLVFIPLLSLYGLRVCPVLSVPGFGFGCYYSGAYIFTANLLNLIFILLMRGQAKYRNLMYAGAYFVATLLALLVLQVMLHLNHLTSHSRAPEILVLASLLLGLLQGYGLNWALQNEEVSSDDRKLPSFQRLWLAHIFRILFPLAVGAAVLLHFLISQSVEFNEGRTAPLGTHDSMIEQTSYVIIFLLSWMFITLTFHFLSEKDHVGVVQSHLDHLHDLDFKFRSKQGQSWGLWAAIINQLNSFSKVLGERTHLLKTFSRFVTAGVAEQALKNELKDTTGTTRELTVVMSDIRNFSMMSEKLTPHQVVYILNEYFTAMLEVLPAYQITVDKFIGDGILAYVDPDAGEAMNALSENRQAVAASLAMIERLQKLNEKLKEMDFPEIKIGVGIYRGPLVIGLIGSEAKLQHTIIGDTVNRTARLEGLCKELGVSIVISGHVWHSLEANEKNVFRTFGKQVMKGLAEPIEVFGGPLRDIV